MTCDPWERIENFSLLNHSDYVMNAYAGYTVTALKDEKQKTFCLKVWPFVY